MLMMFVTPHYLIHSTYFVFQTLQVIDIVPYKQH